ncbi:MAG: alpha/beta hydrolase [Pseudomonadota bacterium]
MPGMISGDVPIAYELSGPTDGQPVLLLNGLGMQLTQWPPALIKALEDAGYQVLRIDNRDVGLSGRLEGQRAPHPIIQYGMRMFGMSTSAPYRIEDMADDAARVLDALGIGAAHVIGLSMGGIIGQVLAGGAAGRIQSLTCLMTTTGNRSLPFPSGEAGRILFGRGESPKTLDAAVDHLYDMWTFIMTQDGGQTEEELRSWLRDSVERGFSASGWRRQTAAIIETGDIRAYGEAITAPTLVIHGTADPLVPQAAGEDVARTIAGAELVLIEGMGHDLPPKHLPQITERILGHLQATETQPADPVTA